MRSLYLRADDAKDRCETSSIANRQKEWKSTSCAFPYLHEARNEQANRRTVRSREWRRAYSLSVETTMESLCHMVKRFGYQQVFDRQTDTARGRSCYWTILSKIYSWTRQPWHRQALDLLVACPIGRAHQALQKRKRGQTEKATPYRKKPHGKSICRGILHGHSMTTGNYCIYGMTFSFPVSHPARLHLTTKIARWSKYGLPLTAKIILSLHVLYLILYASIGHAVGWSLIRSFGRSLCFGLLFGKTTESLPVPGTGIPCRHKAQCELLHILQHHCPETKSIFWILFSVFFHSILFIVLNPWTILIGNY